MPVTQPTPDAAPQMQGMIHWTGVHWPIVTTPAPQSLSPVFQPPRWDLFRPLRGWLDQLCVQDAQQAHKLCRLIPSQCPFERDVKLLGKTLFHIPPLCKLNPLYDELVALRFRALCYLADECGEDISAYC